MGVKHVDDLNLPVVKFSSGDTIIEQGITANDIYVLQKGELSIVADGIELCTCDKPGTVYGETSVLLKRETGAQVKAVKDVEMLHIANADEFMKEQPELTFSISQILAARLVHMNKCVVDLKNELGYENAPSEKKTTLKDKLYKWMVMTNEFFDREVAHPLTPTEKEEQDQ